MVPPSSPEVHPYMRYCFQTQRAYKRSSTSPADAKQVEGDDEDSDYIQNDPLKPFQGC